MPMFHHSLSSFLKCAGLYNFLLTNYFFVYFPKMKVGLSNHQSVCLSVCVPTNNFWTAW
jgi:hypothetical protein